MKRLVASQGGVSCSHWLIWQLIIKNHWYYNGQKIWQKFQFGGLVVCPNNCRFKISQKLLLACNMHVLTAVWYTANSLNLPIFNFFSGYVYTV
jgi:hypothetical protein